MRYLIFAFIILLLSIFFGIELAKTHNYILIVYDKWVIESSLWFAIIVLAILFILLYILFRLLGKTTRIGKKYHAWKSYRRDRKARVLTDQGLCELAEGYWSRAEETLVKAAQLNKRPLIDYLAAAKAAQAQNAYDRRDNYLRAAHATDKDATVAIGLTQAQLQIEGKQWEQALATLQHLNSIAPNHGHTLKLLSDVFVELREWSKCQKLLPALKKTRALTDKDFQQLERRIYWELLLEANVKGATQLMSYWKTLPNGYQQDPEFVTQYVKSLLSNQQDAIAKQVIESYLKKQWHSPLAALYGQLENTEAMKQLQTAENWYKRHPNDPALLLCLGELCRREKLWGKAKEYLIRSIKLQPSPEAYYEMGKLHDMLNEQVQAQVCFHKALQFSK